MREGVTAIENLAQLLRSRNVGPRQLGHALPEMRLGCASLATAIVELKTAMDDYLAGDAEGRRAFLGMLEHASLRVDELGAAIKSKEPTQLDARERLALEAVVRGIGGELDSMLRLIDLVGAAATIRTADIDLSVLLTEQRRSSQRLTPVNAIIELRAPTFNADARVVLELIEFAVATVVRGGVDSPRIVADLETQPDGPLLITVGQAPGERSLGVPLKTAEDLKNIRILNVPLRKALPHEAEVVQAAARFAGFAFVVSEDGKSVTIRSLVPVV
ncbi:MAG: hypothetical protein U0359_18410 [Byssovorax sp.]